MKPPRRQSNLDFRLMSLEFRLRDWLRPPARILQETGVQAGMTVLDFGCGPGGFTLAAARLVGPEGRVIAVDIHPLAGESVQRAASREGLGNIQVVLGDTAAVPDRSVDVALLYDVLHGLSEPFPVLREMHRVLKPTGVLSVSDHHLKEAALTAVVTTRGLYRPVQRSRRAFQFEKTDRNGAAQ